MGIQLKTIVPKSVHGVIKVRRNFHKAVGLVDVGHLLERYVSVFEGFGQRHGLLIMHVVIVRTMYHHELFTSYTFHQSGYVGFVISY